MSEWDGYYKDDGLHFAKAPYDFVVSYLRRYVPAGSAVFEVGVGGGANLLWAAQQGWRVSGSDTSELAREHTRSMFELHDLSVNLFADDLPDRWMPAGYWSGVIDRACLSYTPKRELPETIDMIHGMLEYGGTFLFNPFGVACSEGGFDGQPKPEVYAYTEIAPLFPENDWKICEHRIVTNNDMLSTHTVQTHQVIVRKH